MTPITSQAVEKISYSQGIIHPQLLSISEDQTRYMVTILQAGKNKNGWTMPGQVLADNQTKFAGAPCQIDHHGWFDMPSLTRMAGTIESPFYQDQALKGYLRLWDTPAGELLQRIFNAWLEDVEAGLQVADIGLSAVLWISFDYIDDERIASEIKMVESVDAVLHPAAGGKVEHVFNSVLSTQGHSPPNERSIIMPEEVTTSPIGGNQAAPAIDPPSTDATPELSLQAALATIQRAADRIQDLTGQVDQMASQVDRLTAVVAEHEADRTVTGLGQAPRDPDIQMGRNSYDRVMQAFEAMMQGRHPPEGIQPLTGIREFYHLMSGDYEMTGRFHQDRVYLANVNSSTMAAVCANALNKMVVNQFAQYPKWWEPLVIEMDFSTLQDARWITLGGVGELPTVTEGAAYTELTWDDNTETEAFVKKGGYLGLTLEAIDKDDTRRLRMAPQALAQAAWLTLGKSMSAIFTDNSGTGPTLADAAVLFSTGHGNLGTTALSHAEWSNVRATMRAFTDLASGEILGAICAPKFLLVPPELETTALQVLATEHTPGSADWNANPFAEGDGWRARMENARQRVIVVDLWTDANNWAAVADPNLYPSLAIGYRYGRTPEIFSVASPTAGLMFSNDVMPIKVRFFYAAGPCDWRGLYKENVT